MLGHAIFPSSVSDHVLPPLHYGDALLWASGLKQRNETKIRKRTKQQNCVLNHFQFNLQYFKHRIEVLN